MAAALVHKILSKRPVVPMVWAKSFSKEGDLVEKAKVGRYKCWNEKCRHPSNKEPWTYRSRKGLIQHIRAEHEPNRKDGEFCTHCGNLKGKEDECTFLSPHEPACAAKPNNLSRAQVEAILVKQYRDRKK